MKTKYHLNNLTDSVRILLIFLFAYTAFSKLLSPSSFAATMIVVHIPKGIARIAAIIIPFAEIILVILLIINRTKRLGLYGSLGIMLSFTVYIIYMKTFLPKLPCSCGGLIQKLSWTQHLILNIGIIAAIFVAIQFDKRYTLNLYYNKQVIS